MVITQAGRLNRRCCSLTYSLCCQPLFVTQNGTSYVLESTQSTLLTCSVPIAAGGLALAAYLDGKYQLKRDATALYRLTRNRKIFEKSAKEKKISIWYPVADACRKYPNNLAIWSRDGCYTFAEFHDRTMQWAHWFIEQGIQPRELVAMYMRNRPEFMMIWMALLCIGAAPAFINNNLEDKALIHCLSVCDSKLLIVDPDSECQGRIEKSRAAIEKNTKIVILDEQLKHAISSKPMNDPGNSYRDGLKQDDPCCLIYTRYICLLRGGLC